MPGHISVIRDELFCAQRAAGADEPYFKMRHDLQQINQPPIDARYLPFEASVVDFVRHIKACYTEEGLTVDELFAYRQRPVFDDALWLAWMDRETGQIVASGIAEIDRRIGEGVLEWIQVSPEYRRKGLGQGVVCELLRRMQGKATFATVSGRVNHPTNPMALYRACGFYDSVIWHVVTAPIDLE